MRLMLTGGAGYIGAHTLVELLLRDHEVGVIDSFAGSSPAVLDRVRELAPGRAFEVFEIDVRDRDAMVRAFAGFRPDAVVHFAGLKAVGESEADPLAYYDVNVGGTVGLLEAMTLAGCQRMIFSSSATVYGEPVYLPYDEDHPLAPTSPYGWTKRMAEQISADWARATPGARVMALRYFNPVGAHPSGRIGEDPTGTPANLMPYLAQVASGRFPSLRIWGEDYDTHDGTGVRDYIHVVDLALAHIAGLEDLAKDGPTFEALNIGTGRGLSVREMLQAFSAVVGRALPATVEPRRPGDIAAMEADCSRAAARLGWTATRGVDDMVESLWRWQQHNPEGYGAAKSR